MIVTLGNLWVVHSHSGKLDWIDRFNTTTAEDDTSQSAVNVDL